METEYGHKTRAQNTDAKHRHIYIKAQSMTRMYLRAHTLYVHPSVAACYGHRVQLCDFLDYHVRLTSKQTGRAALCAAVVVEW